MNTQSNATPLEWRELVASYRTPSVARSLWQIASTFLPFCLIWYGMYRSLAHGYWLTLLLAPIEAGLLVRIFILFHDCGHASFSRRNGRMRYWGGSVVCSPGRHMRIGGIVMRYITPHPATSADGSRVRCCH